MSHLGATHVRSSCTILVRGCLRQGKHDECYAELEGAVARYDALPYDEPAGYLMSPRQTYGALLAEKGHYRRAIAVYDADLALFPKNIWSLAGLRLCLSALGGDATGGEAAERLAGVEAAHCTVLCHRPSPTADRGDENSQFESRESGDRAPLLVAGHNDGKVSLFTFPCEKPAEAHTQTGHSRAVAACCVLADSSTAVSAGKFDGVVLQWRIVGDGDSNSSGRGWRPSGRQVAQRRLQQRTGTCASSEQRQQR